MTHPLVEQVARAICRADGVDPDATSFGLTAGSVGDKEWHGYIPHALDALAAVLAGIREPSEGMLNSAICNPTNENIMVARRNVAAFSWRAMIDALAKEVSGDG